MCGFAIFVAIELLQKTIKVPELIIKFNTPSQLAVWH